MRDTKTLDQINADLATHPPGCQCPGHMMIEIKRLKHALKHWQDVAATYLLENELLNAKMANRPVTKQIEQALDAAAARQRDRGDG